MSEPKKKNIALALAGAGYAFQVYGLHRFYTGHMGLGVAQLLTFGGCGIWQLIDLINIFTGKYLDAEGNALEG